MLFTCNLTSCPSTAATSPFRPTAPPSDLTAALSHARDVYAYVRKATNGPRVYLADYVANLPVEWRRHEVAGEAFALAAATKAKDRAVERGDVAAEVLTATEVFGEKCLPHGTYVLLLHPSHTDCELMASVGALSSAYSVALRTIALVFVSRIPDCGNVPAGTRICSADFKKEGKLFDAGVTELVPKEVWAVTADRNVDAVLIASVGGDSDGDASGDGDVDATARPNIDIVIAMFRNLSIAPAGPAACDIDARKRQNGKGMKVMLSHGPQKGEYGRAGWWGLPRVSTSCRTGGAAGGLESGAAAQSRISRASQGAAANTPSDSLSRHHSRTDVFVPHTSPNLPRPRTLISIYSSPKKKKSGARKRKYSSAFRLSGGGVQANASRRVDGIIDAPPDARRVADICFIQNAGKVIASTIVVWLVKKNILPPCGDAWEREVERAFAAAEELEPRAVPVGLAGTLTDRDRRALARSRTAVAAPAGGEATPSAAVASRTRSGRACVGATAAPPLLDLGAQMKRIAAVVCADNSARAPAFARLLASDCVVTAVASPVSSHSDRKGKTAGGPAPFVEALSRLELEARGGDAPIKRSTKKRKKALRGSETTVGCHEGALLLPALRACIAYAPDSDVLLVNLFFESHLVIAANALFDRLRYGVGGSRTSLILTLADWPKR